MMLRLVLVSLCLLSAVAAQQPGRRLALLVGVTEYPELERYCIEAGFADRYRSRIQLRGPVHDVERMQQTLVAVLEMDPADVRTLAGWPGLERDRPTRANIAAEMARLAEVARGGDLVVVYLAGHGSQVPDLDGDEVDGYDEVFLPADTQRWDPGADEIPGAILDDEIGQWVGAIRKTGARVLFLADSCFSGTLLRGDAGDDEVAERSRSLQPDLIGGPSLGTKSRAAAAGTAAGTAAAATAGTAAGAEAAVAAPASGEVPDDQILHGLSSGVAAMFAVDSRQQAIECRLPRRDGVYHGVFTWHLTQQLARCGPGVSLGELHRQIVAALCADHRGHLQPTLMGEVDNALVDGAPVGLRLQVGQRDGSWYVAGGSIHGLRQGDVLEVFERGRRGDAAALVGRLEVAAVSATEGRLRAAGDTPLQIDAAQLEGLLPARIAKTSLDLRRLRLAARGAVPDGVRAATAAEAGFARRAVWVGADGQGTDDVDAEVHFAPDGGGELRVVEAPGSAPLRFAKDGLPGAVFKLYRARNLRRLSQDLQVGELPEGLVVRFELLAGEAAPRLLQAGEVVRPGTPLRLVVENDSDADWDVYAFVIDTELGVSTLLPQRGRGATVLNTDGAPTVRSLRFNDKTLGAEEILVMVVPKGSPSLLPLAYDYQGAESASRGIGAQGLVQDLARGVEGAAMRGLDDDEGGEIATVRLLPYAVGWGRQPAEMPPGALDLAAAEELLAPWRRSDDAPFLPEVDSARPRGLGTVYERCAQSVVVVRNRVGYGTGFLVDSDLQRIVTNYHVVKDGLRYDDRGRWVVQLLVGRLDDDGMMKLWRDDVTAEVIQADAHRDLALLQVTEGGEALAGRPALAMATSPPRPGLDCVILGHPSSGMLWSFRSGSVSAIGSFPHDRVEAIVAVSGLRGAPREAALAQLSAQQQLDVLMSTCGANRGDSGGPLVDMEGRVVGVTFAVPSDAHDKEFTYHVHPRELTAFLAAAPAADAVATLPPQVPDAWQLGAEALWQKDHPAGVAALWTRTEPGYRALVIDFDGDSTLPVGAVGEALQAAFAARGDHGAVDAELVLQFTAGERIAHYDTDADGQFDLVLVDNDDDEAADVAFTKVGGAWRCEHTERHLIQLPNLGGIYNNVRSEEYRRAATALIQLLR